MDVLYVLGTGSLYGKNDEIRYSLRSLEKHLSGMSRVFIVGECPSWSKGVIHIPCEDIHDPALNADGNIIHKVLTGCNSGLLSDDFLFINDDHILLGDIAANALPCFHKGDMTTYDDRFWAVNFWRGRLKRTKDELVRRGLPALHFDTHTPIVMNKKKFVEVMSLYDHATGVGYCMKSLYANTVGCVPTAHKEVKVFQPLTYEQIKHVVRGAQMFAFNNDGFNKDMHRFLADTFPQASRFERPIPTHVQKPKFQFQWLKK